MGGFEALSLDSVEPSLKYHPGIFEVLTLTHYLGRGQCLVGSLTGAVSSQRVTEELGSERRETVRSLSAVGVGKLRKAAPSTRGPEWTNPWCLGCHANGIAQ